MQNPYLHENMTVPQQKLPVVPRNPPPLVVVNRWLLVDKSVLVKTYEFDSFENRNKFVQEVFQHEEVLGHRADVRASVDNNGKPIVVLSLRTQGVDVVTELDKEFAKFADVVFRDLTYNLKHGRFTL